MRYNISLPNHLWEAAKIKAGITPMSAIIRRLLEKWLSGEISAD